MVRLRFNYINQPCFPARIFFFGVTSNIASVDITLPSQWHVERRLDIATIKVATCCVGHGIYFVPIIKHRLYEAQYQLRESSTMITLE
jgi:hypothetical protein